MLSEDLITHHPIRQPNRSSLRTIARAWSRRTSGQLQIAGSPETFQLRGGEPVLFADLLGAISGMYSTGVQLRDVQAASSRTPQPCLGAHLWYAAGKLAPQRVALGSTCLVEGVRGFSSASRLPLSRVVSGFLSADRTPRTTIADILAAEGLAWSSVEEEMARLVALGFYRFRTPSQSTYVTRTATGTGGARKRRGEMRSAVRSWVRSPERTRARLQRDWEVIKAADDWTVIGASPHFSPDLIRDCCQRMLERYAALTEHHDPQVRLLAQQIHARVELSAERLLTGRSSRTRPQTISAEDAFSRGVELFHRQHFTEAHRAFATAWQQQPGESRYMAWTGFAGYHDPQHPPESRTTKAREMLEMAISLGPQGDLPVLLLGRLELKENNPDRARALIEALLQRSPDNAEARALLEKL